MPAQKILAFDAIWIAAALLTIEKCSNNADASKEDLFFEPIDILNLAEQFSDEKMTLFTVTSQVSANQKEAFRNYLQADSLLHPSFRRLSKMDECSATCFPIYLNSKKYSDARFKINTHAYSIENIFQFVKNEFPEYLKHETDIQIDDGFWPKETDYHPGISKEQWIELLQNPLMIKPRNYEMLLHYYRFGKPATCREIAKVFHRTPSDYNMLGDGVGRTLHKHIHCPVYQGESHKYAVIPLLRKVEGNRIILKLRPELRAAFAEIERSKLEKSRDSQTRRDFEKNIIIYGPSKTGKKILAMQYALAFYSKRPILEPMNTSNQVTFQSLVHMNRIVHISIEGLLQENLIQNLKEEHSDAKVIYIENLSDINQEDIERLISNVQKIKAFFDCKIIGILDSEKFHDADGNIYLTSAFHFIEVRPDVQILREIGADKLYNLDIALMLEKINQRIEYLADWKLTIGHDYFLTIKDDHNLKTFQNIFESQVFPIICSNFKNDYKKIQLILGDNAKKDDIIKFIIDEEVSAKNIFKGDFTHIIEMNKKRFSVNQAAFGIFESYLEII